MKRATGRAFSTHESPGQGATNDWLTPRWVLDALGPFDLDVAASESDPYRCAPFAYTWREDGLHNPWNGLFVWCNPPYGPHAGKFLIKLAEHGHGIALVFARTDTKTFTAALQRSDAALFIAGRLQFEKPGGLLGPSNAGAPSMLLGYGEEAKRRLLTCSIPGVRVTPVREAA